jgi:hypothetical protein
LASQTDRLALAGRSTSIRKCRPEAHQYHALRESHLAVAGIKSPGLSVPRAGVVFRPRTGDTRLLEIAVSFLWRPTDLGD